MNRRLLKLTIPTLVTVLMCTSEVKNDEVADVQPAIEAAMGSTRPLPLSFPSMKTGIHLQSGYTGYLIPEDQVEKLGFTDPITDLLSKKGLLSEVKKLITSFLKFIFKVALKLATAATVAASFIILSFGISTAICKTTTLCSIHVKELEWSSDDVEEAVRAYMTPDKVTALSEYVLSSITKFKNKFGKINEKTTKQ